MMKISLSHGRSFSLRLVFVVMVAIGIGMAVSQMTPAGRSPMMIPWIVLCAPSFTLISILVTIFNVLPGAPWGAIFAMTTGLIYGLYAVLALVPRTKSLVLFAFLFHGACIVSALVLMALNC
jgi:hypothetical protein